MKAENCLMAKIRELRTKDDVVKALKKEWPYLREKYGVTRLALFGSFAKGAAQETSDIDLLVELAQPLGFEFIDLADYLEQVFGRKVDIATFDSWRRSFANPRRRPIAEDVERNLLYV
jgi:predicted nucleotidyltransferase